MVSEFNDGITMLLDETKNTDQTEQNKMFFLSLASPAHEDYRGEIPLSRNHHAPSAMHVSAANVHCSLSVWLDLQTRGLFLGRYYSNVGVECPVNVKAPSN